MTKHSVAKEVTFTQGDRDVWTMHPEINQSSSDRLSSPKGHSSSLIPVFV